MVNSPVLVLNQNYEPLNICKVRRAVVLLHRGKAELLENGSGVLRAPRITLPLPSVIRLISLIKRPRPQRRLTRAEVFNRDGHTCQYCGRQTRELTLDHVIPRYRDGEHVWENVVSACIPCNHRKAGRTPAEAGMRLIRHPVSPKVSGFYIPYHYLRAHRQWLKFVPQRQEPGD